VKKCDATVVINKIFLSKKRKNEAINNAAQVNYFAKSCITQNI
jgi:hypothetical protein